MVHDSNRRCPCCNREMNTVKRLNVITGKHEIVGYHCKCGTETVPVLKVNAMRSMV